MGSFYDRINIPVVENRSDNVPRVYTRGGLFIASKTPKNVDTTRIHDLWRHVHVL